MGVRSGRTIHPFLLTRIPNPLMEQSLVPSSSARAMKLQSWAGYSAPFFQKVVGWASPERWVTSHTVLFFAGTVLGPLGGDLAFPFVEMLMKSLDDGKGLDLAPL